jgi:hypothetical protein
MTHNRFICLVDNRIEVAVKTYEKNGVLVKFVADIHDGPKDYWNSILKSLEECECILCENHAREFEQIPEHLRSYRELFHIWSEFQPSPQEYKKTTISFGDFLEQCINNLGSRIIICDTSSCEIYEQIREVLPNPQDIDQYILTIFHRYLDEHFDTPVDNKKFCESFNKLAYEDIIGKVMNHYRNKNLIKSIRQNLDKGLKNLGIFYGASHGNDIEDFLINEGFKLSEEIWIVNRD